MSMPCMFPASTCPALANGSAWCAIVGYQECLSDAWLGCDESVSLLLALLPTVLLTGLGHHLVPARLSERSRATSTM